MGDSIKQARAFMRCCDTALTDLTELSANDAIHALVSIQTGAKLNHARAIYRAAQDAIEHVSKGSLDERVATLSHLIKQYRSGLVELEAEIETAPSSETTEEENDIVVSPSATPDVITVDFSEEARRQRALTALSDSLPLAKNDEREALSCLMRLAQDTTASGDSSNEDTSIDTIIGITPTPLSQTLPTPLPKTVNKVSLESFIGDVVQQGLTYARQSELTLSLSYDMGTIALPEAKSGKIKRRMERWLGSLVHHVAVNSEKGALAHIDMSATPAAVIFSASAPAFEEDIFSAANDKDLVHQEFDTETGMLRLHLSLTEGVPLLKPTKLPVEEGIGARLDALMADTVSPKLDGLALDDSNLLAFEPVNQKRASS